jgi:hypothetical protein
MEIKKLLLSVLGRARRPDPVRPNPLWIVRPNGAHPATTAMAAAAFLACAPRPSAHALCPYKAAVEPPARLALARRRRPASHPQQPHHRSRKVEPARALWILPPPLIPGRASNTGCFARPSRA